MRSWLLGLAFAFGLSGQAFAQDLVSATVGSHVSEVARVYDRLVPLPPGDFELISRRNGKADLAKDFQGRVTGSGDQSDLAFIWLVSAPRGIFDTAVWIRTNGPGHFGGWYLEPGICKPTASPFFAYANPDNTTRNADCWLVGYRSFTLAQNSSSDYKEFMARTDALQRPKYAVAWTLLVVRNGDHAWVQYMFNPAKWKIPPTESWAPETAMNDPKKARVYNALAGQTRSLAEAIQLGVTRRQPKYSWQLD